MANSDYNSGKASAVKFFMVLSCIASVVGGIATIARGNLTGGIILLVSLVWTIPMTVFAFRRLNAHEYIGTGFKICILLFHNLIAGIILLCMNTEGEKKQTVKAASIDKTSAGTPDKDSSEIATSKTSATSVTNYVKTAVPQNSTSSTTQQRTTVSTIASTSQKTTSQNETAKQPSTPAVTHTGTSLPASKPDGNGSSPYTTYPPTKRTPDNFHNWTYEEDEFCVRMVFYNYVQYKYHDVSGVVAEIYEHLKCVIKSSSIHMKLSNIKHLLSEEHITNSLSVKPLSQASSQCRKAFERVYAEFKKNGGRINDPMNDTPDTKQTRPTITDDISYTRYTDSTQSTFVTPPKTVSPGYRYQWKYSDDEFCVRMVFYNFIYHHSHDVQEVVTKIYIHLNGAIKESSIHMKLSNIKYLLDEEGIESSMPDSSLSQVSNQCRRAFNRVYEEYKNNGYKIADPTKKSMPGAGPDGGPDLTPPPPPKPELPTYKIKVILNGETYFYRHNVHDNTNNLIKDFGFLRATALFQVESKITAEALQKQYPSAIIEIVENVTK